MQTPPKIRVLHVDDDASFVNVSKKILEVQGPFTVETALSVDEALTKLNSASFDVVISDYYMPSKNGLDFLKLMREKNLQTPFILFTGKGREEIIVRALNLGADRYVDKHGDPEAVYTELAVSISQVHEKNQAQRLLWESEERFKKMVTNSKDLIMLTGSDGVILYLSPSCKAILGYEPDELVGKIPWVIHPDDLESVQNIFQAALTSEISGTAEYRINNKQGETRWISHSFSQIIENGKLKQIVSIIRDVTDTKNAEKKLQESEERYRFVTEHAEDVLTVTDANGTFLYVSPSIKRVLGYTPEELVGKKDILDFLNKDDIERYTPKMKLLLETGELPPLEFRFPNSNGVEVWFETKVSVVLDNSEAIRFISISREITQRRKDREERDRALAQAELLLEKLSVVGGFVRHDIRNKLSLMTNVLFLSKKYAGDNQQMLRLIEQIGSATASIVRILELAQTYEAVGNQGLFWIDVNRAISDAQGLFAGLGDLQIETANSNFEVFADSALVEIFHNLIDNSLKYGKNLSTIKIYTEKKEDSRLIVYEDNGGGIDAKIKPHLFQKGCGNGTGLGLYLIQRICDVYGWGIKESGQPGFGVRFEIAVPEKLTRQASKTS